MTAPDVVSMDTIAPHLAHDATYVLGLTDDQTPIRWSPQLHGPLQIIAGVGAGGTTLLRALTLQALHTGAARVDIIALKRAGWSDLAGTTGLTLHNHITDAAVEAIMEADAEAQQRTKSCANGQGIDRLPPHLVVVDDLGIVLLEHQAGHAFTSALRRLYTHGHLVGVHLLTRSYRILPELPRVQHTDTGAWADTLALARLSPFRSRALVGGTDPLPVPGESPVGRWMITLPEYPVVTAPAAMPSRTVGFTAR